MCEVSKGGGGGGDGKVGKFCVFFFQAEDGIRDWSVTGVQTCALPISRLSSHGHIGDDRQFRNCLRSTPDRHSKTRDCPRDRKSVV